MHALLLLASNSAVVSPFGDAYILATPHLGGVSLGDMSFGDASSWRRLIFATPNLGDA